MKKTVLFINGHLKVGGCERSLVNVLKNIDFDEYSVDLLLLEELGDYANEIPEDVRIRLCSLNNAFGSFSNCITQAVKNKDFFSVFFRIFYVFAKKISTKCFRLLRYLFKDLSCNYDAVIAYRPGICTELAAYVFKGKKKISWWHNGEMIFFEKQAESLHKSYQLMTNVVAVSESSAKLVTDTFPDISDKVKIIPNMLCSEDIKLKAKQKQDEIKKQDGVLTLISVGRLSPEKNMTLCPKIGKALSEAGVDFRWYIVGDGEDEMKIKDLIRAFHLQNEMISVGRLSNPYPLIEEADMLVHPSLVESQGLTLLESMALGTPVIAVESNGPKEFVINGENGLLVDADTVEIYSAIMKLKTDESMKKRFVDNGFETVKKFSPDVIMKKIKLIV